jgi:4-amino-4-deoxy-L-arabinose transferase-like glycosyltransferase
MAALQREAPILSPPDLGGRRKKLWCTGIFLVALLARLAYFAATEPRRTPDSREYITFAQNIRAHGTFTLSTAPPLIPSIRRAPIYPAFLALVGANDSASALSRVRLIQGFLDALIAAAIGWLAWGRVKPRWAVFAGALYALHPAALAYSGAILSEALFTFLFSSAAMALVLAARSERTWGIAVAGVLAGLAGLCRPIAAPFFVVVLGLIYYRSDLFRRPLRVAAIFSAAALLTMAPWIIRSSRLAGRFVMVSATGTVNLSLATTNGPWDINDQASIFVPNYYWTVDPCGRSYARAVTAPESAAADQICLREAIQNLNQDSGYYFRNRVRQLIHFPLTSFDFFTGNATSLGAALRQRSYSVLATKLSLYGLFALLPLLAGITGLVARPRTFEKAACGAAWLFTLFIYLPGFVEYRYFFPAVPALLVTAAFGLDYAERTALVFGRRFVPAREAREARVA